MIVRHIFGIYKLIDVSDKNVYHHLDVLNVLKLKICTDCYQLFACKTLGASQLIENVVHVYYGYVFRCIYINVYLIIKILSLIDK